MPPAAPTSFEPTRWSLVLRAREGDDASRRGALETLCATYWYPIYAFLRRSGRSPEDAQDLAQDFFVRLLDGRLLEGADPAKGKFRTLLLAALKNLDANAHAAAKAAKRGGNHTFVSLDAGHAEEHWQADTRTDEPVERLFDRAWAETLLSRSSERLRGEFEEKGREGLFSALYPRLTGGDSEGLSRVAEGLGLSEDAVKMALSRLRRRFGEVLREEVSETVGSRGDVQEELRYLLSNFL